MLFSVARNKVTVHTTVAVVIVSHVVVVDCEYCSCSSCTDCIEWQMLLYLTTTSELRVLLLYELRTAAYGRLQQH